SWVTSNRRRPSRKIAWSSAIRIRIGRVVILCDGMQFLLGDFDFQTRATARPGIDREFSTDGAHALVDDQGTLMSTLQIRMRKPATELKAATIIINRENPISFLRTKPNQNIVCTAMPGHIHQRFLDDAGDLATDMWGKGHIAKHTDGIQSRATTELHRRAGRAPLAPVLPLSHGYAASAIGRRYKPRAPLDSQDCAGTATAFPNSTRFSDQVQTVWPIRPVRLKSCS